MVKRYPFSVRLTPCGTVGEDLYAHEAGACNGCNRRFKDGNQWLPINIYISDKDRYDYVVCSGTCEQKLLDKHRIDQEDRLASNRWQDDGGK